MSNNHEIVRNHIVGHKTFIDDEVLAHNAKQVKIADSGGHFTGEEVETALQEIGADLSTISPEKTYSVSPSGADYTTIQAALDDNVTTNIMIVVYPGTYTDDSINFTANNQYVVGAQNVAPKTVLITKATTICNYGAFTGCIVKDVKMIMTLLTTEADSTVDGLAGGSCNFKHCHTECVAPTGTIGGTVAGGSTCLRGHGAVKFIDGSIIKGESAK